VLCHLQDCTQTADNSSYLVNPKCAYHGPSARLPVTGLVASSWCGEPGLRTGLDIFLGDLLRTVRGSDAPATQQDACRRGKETDAAAPPCE
jgi:hypothetical protein